MRNNKMVDELKEDITKKEDELKAEYEYYSRLKDSVDKLEVLVEKLKNTPV